MANEHNLIPIRSESEAREKGKKGGKASGETRRRKADFNRTLNALLTAKIDSPDWTPILEQLGLEPTLESAMLMAQIKEALTGSTKAARFVAEYAGQSTRTTEERKNIKADTELKKARKDAVTGERQTGEALDRLDQILKGVRDNAAEQETE